MSSPPPVDLDDRAIGVARVLPAGLSCDEYAAVAFVRVASWAQVRCTASLSEGSDHVDVRCESGDFDVTWSFTAKGLVSGIWQWDGSSFTDGHRFAPEVTLSRFAQLTVLAPDAAQIWRYPVDTFRQIGTGTGVRHAGEASVPLFDARSERAEIELILK